MHWIITKDLIASEGEKPSTRKRAPQSWISAYKGATDDAKKQMLEDFKATMNYEFRLLDDDDEVYYEGLCKDLNDQCEDNAFDPLDWAMSNAGCAYMQYRKRGSKQWQTL